MTWRGMAAACVAAAVVAGTVASAGCSSSSSSASPADASATEASSSTPSTEAGPTGDAGTYALSWNVGTTVSVGIGGDAAVGMAGPDGSINPISGVEVCVDGHSEIPCTTSAADGTFTLSGLPGGANLPITLVKNGYVSVLKPVQMGRTDVMNEQYPVFMQLASDPLPDAGLAIDQNSKGSVNVFLLSTSPPADAGPNGPLFSLVPNGTLTLSPQSGLGPEYVDNNNLIDTTATSMVGVSAMFYNLAPGNYTVTAAAPNFDCEAINFPFSADGYPNGVKHQTAFPVLAGYIDLVGLLCSPMGQFVGADGG